jgi:cytochrome P450
MKQMSDAGGGDIVSDFALPYVIACLTTIYKRPQDLEEWLSWGPDVWTAETHRDKAKRAAAGLSSEHLHDVRSGTTLQAYLDSVFDAAETNQILDPEKQDVWDFVSQLVVDGVGVTREEMQGIANVLLAGGRDTVIKLICGLVWHLIGHSEDREFLASNPQWFNRTIAEMVRFLSPLPKMERALADQAALADDQRDPEKYVLLNFVSANYDRQVWPDAEVINIHRERKPHLAFGFGRHSCLGMNVTEHEVGALLGVLLTEWPDWKFASEPAIEWARDEDAAGNEIRYISRFDRLEVKI